MDVNMDERDEAIPLYMSFERAVLLVLDIHRDPLWHFKYLLHLSNDDAYAVWACPRSRPGADEEFLTPTQWATAQERERQAYERTVPTRSFRKRSKAS